ncbi:HNH endonuclease signature motif containing protein [Virgibacillus flavescens]|uniref:HNH endonuclease signature motif containing protein n=1 Tax=Virgibacillus flavescens TaxID=1611422 RepID=UPI003D3574E4
MWKVVKGYDDYLVNEKGEVKHAKTDKVVKQKTIKSGYNKVRLKFSFRYKEEYVCMIVYNSFTNKGVWFPEHLKHIDSNLSNDRFTNLKYVGWGSKETVVNIDFVQESEEWKQIKIYPNYFVSKLGEIFSPKTNKVIKQGINTGGYRTVNISVDGNGTRLLVHRLVAEAFISNPENKPVVNHIDCNRSNASVDNLEWVTHRENSIHMVNSYNSPGQTITELLDKEGNFIDSFPSNSRCVSYIKQLAQVKKYVEENETGGYPFEFEKDTKGNYNFGIIKLTILL